MEPEESTVCRDFINAKVRGMRSKLLESDRLLALTDVRTLPELFRRIYPTETFPGHVEFERRLAADTLQELSRVSRYLSGDLFELFLWLMVHYQVENLKGALRLYLARGTRQQAEAWMVPTPRWLALDLDRLFEAQDLRKFAAAVPVPELRDALLAALEATEAPGSATLDTALDSAYLKKLSSLGRTGWGGADWIRRLTGFDVDCRNLLLLLRAKFNYERPLAEIRRFLVPAGVFFSLRTAERIDSAAGLPEAIGLALEACVPAALRRGVASLPQLEDVLQLHQYRLATRCFAESVLKDALVIGYYYIKRAELANVIRLTEALRHGLARDEVERRLLVVSR